MEPISELSQVYKECLASEKMQCGQRFKCALRPYIAARTRNTKQHLRFQIEFLKLLYHQHFMVPQRTAWKPRAYQSGTVCNPAEADLQLLCNCLLGACLALGCQVLLVPGWSTIRGNRPYLTEAPRPYTPNSQSTPQPGRQQVCCPCTDTHRRFAFRHGAGTTGL